MARPASFRRIPVAGVEILALFSCFPFFSLSFSLVFPSVFLIYCLPSLLFCCFSAFLYISISLYTYISILLIYLVSPSLYTMLPVVLLSLASAVSASSNYTFPNGFDPAQVELGTKCEFFFFLSFFLQLSYLSAKDCRGLQSIG